MAKDADGSLINSGVYVNFVKTHDDAKLPTQAHSGHGIGDSGYDLYSVESVTVPAHGSVVVPVGLKLAYISSGYWFRIEGRSGLGFKYSVQPHAGIIDNQYKGDLGVKLYNLSDVDCDILKGKAIAQIIFYPLIQANLAFVDTVVESARGEKGFGSSDKQS
jgi:dUTP pyrophosphatase